MTPIDLDYNASTPIAPEVVAVMAPLLMEAYGNPSSGHWAGAPAKAIFAVEGRAESLPFLDASFDAATAMTVLCFVPDAKAAVREMARVLRPDGRLVIGELGRWSLGRHGGVFAAGSARRPGRRRDSGTPESCAISPKPPG